MKQKQFDLFVLGAGSAGVRAARLASSRGWYVGIAEDFDFGGTCVHRGCIPKKLYHYAAQIAYEMKLAHKYGFFVSMQFEWKKLQENKARELARLGELYQRTLQNSGVEIFPLQGKITQLGTIQFPETAAPNVQSKKILIATGAQPSRPDPKIFGEKLDPRILSSDELFSLPELPKRIVIYGSGYIGMEFACLLQGLGVQVTLVTRSSQILRKFDNGIGQFFSEQLKHLNISVHLGTEICGIEGSPDNLQISLTSQNTSKPETGKSSQSTPTGKIPCDVLLWAIGRIPNVSQLGLHENGIRQSENGAIIVDQSWETNVPGIYAIGDVIDQMQLTPVAIAQAKSFVQKHFPPTKAAPDSLSGEVGGIAQWETDGAPTAIFTIPNIATVGLSEQACLKQGIPIQVYQRKFRTLKESLSSRPPDMFLKLIVCAKEGKILGIHGVGDNVSEMIQCLAAAMQAGLTKDHLDQTLPIHPTSAEEFLNMPLRK